MPQSKLTYLIVGTFVIAAVAGLIVVLSVISGRGGESSTYYTRYDNVEGLKFGTPVFFEGFLAGQVDAITPELRDGRTSFRLSLKILSRLKIPEGSRADIIQPNLLSGRAITIAVGDGPKVIKPGGEIPPGPTSGLAALPDLVGSGQNLMISASELLVQMNQAAAQVNAWLQDDFPTLAGSYQELPGTLESELNALSGETRQVIGQVGDVMARAERVLSDRNLDDIDRIIADVHDTTARLEEVSRKLGGISDNVQAMTAQMHDFVADNKADMEGTVVDLRYTMETIARRVDAMTLNLEGTSRNLFEFSREIRRNPGLLLGGTAPKDEAAGRR